MTEPDVTYRTVIQESMLDFFVRFLTTPTRLLRKFVGMTEYTGEDYILELENEF
jgi:hypothetical protein